MAVINGDCQFSMLFLTDGWGSVNFCRKNCCYDGQKVYGTVSSSVMLTVSGKSQFPAWSTVTDDLMKSRPILPNGPKLASTSLMKSPNFNQKVKRHWL